MKLLVAAALFLLCSRPGAEPPAGAEDALEDIVKRLDAEEPGARSEAQKDLARWRESAGEKAEALLAAAATKSDAPEARASLQAELRVLRRRREDSAFFDKWLGRSGLPSVVGKERLVLDAEAHEFAWILSETKDSYVLLTNSLDVETHEKSLGSQRSDLRDEIAQVLAGEYTLRGRGRADPVVLPMLLGWWACQRGWPDLASDCAEMVREELKDREAGQSKPPPADFADTCLSEALARFLRDSALNGARIGTPRPDLVARWKGIAALPKHAWSAEAQEMVLLYEAQVREDAASTGVRAEDIPEQDVAARIEFWIGRMKDVGWSPSADERSWRPIDELVRLGWDAVPEVAAHLDDRGPTRLLENTSGGGLEDHTYVESTGGACSHVLGQVTRLDIDAWAKAREIVVSDKVRNSRQEAWKKWWEEEGPKTLEERLADLARDGAPDAARKLLVMNREGGLPVLCRIAEKPGPFQAALLGEMSSWLGEGQKEWLERLLASDDLEVVALATDALWQKCRSDAGARVLIDRFRAGIDLNLQKPRGIEEAIGEICDTHGDYEADAIAEFLKDAPQPVRLAAFQRCYRIRYPQVARSLMEALDDRGECGIVVVGLEENHAVEWRELALDALRSIFEGGGFGGATRDEEIEGFRKWWKENEDEVDWDAMKRR